MLQTRTRPPPIYKKPHTNTQCTQKSTQPHNLSPNLSSSSGRSSGSDSGLKEEMENSPTWSSSSLTSSTSTDGEIDSVDRPVSPDTTSQTNTSIIYQSQRFYASPIIQQHKQPSQSKKLKNKLFRFKKSKKNDFLTSSCTSSMTSIARSLSNSEYIEVNLPVRKYGCLGITIIGQTTTNQHSVGIYCGGIQANSAAAEMSHSIEPGDRVVTIDGEDIRFMSNDQAVDILQQRVSICTQTMSNKTYVCLGLHKYSDKVFNNTVEVKPVKSQPINPADWVNTHSDFYTSFERQKGRHSEDSSVSSSILSSTECDTTPYASLQKLQISERTGIYTKPDIPPLSINMPMRNLLKIANSIKSGLKIKDRNWLRVIIVNAFVGADLVDWLHQNVSGLEDRRDAKQYACSLMIAKLIKPTIQAKPDKFSEKSYYIF